jgi:MoaA/NifB/PqqE/SkfB family radical SAM enzyme
MYISNFRGLSKIFLKKPQLVSIAALNLSHRMVHKLRVNGHVGTAHPPEQLSVFITDRCNLKCKFCHYANTDKPGYKLNQVKDMSRSVYHKLIDEVSGKPLVSFSGGEPLLHPDVAEFVAYAKEKDRLCTLTTNGWLLAKRAQELCEAGLDILIISVDGPRDTHNSIRGENSFERLVAGLEVVFQQPQRPIVFISMAISDMNYDKLIPTYKLAKSWRVDGINFNHLWMHTDKMVHKLRAFQSPFSGDHLHWGIETDLIDVEILADSLETIRQRNWGRSLVVSESPYLNRQQIATWYREPEIPLHKKVRCGWVHMKLWADGKVKPCRNWVVGDLNQQDAMEIWDSQEFNEFRQILAANGMLPICSRCCFIARR